MGIKRLLFVTLGTLFLGVGIIGIVIPILPTTPFLLLATSFFARGSDKFHNWLLNSRILGAYIRHYIDGKGMPLKVKLFTIALLWTAISFTVAFVFDELVMRIALVFVAIGVSVHIVLIKGYREAKISMGSEKD
ncbi:YbaN family protein [Chloroflexota bacterium]